MTHWFKQKTIICYKKQLYLSVIGLAGLYLYLIVFLEAELYLYLIIVTGARAA